VGYLTGLQEAHQSTGLFQTLTEKLIDLIYLVLGEGGCLAKGSRQEQVMEPKPFFQSFSTSWFIADWMT
jgi:hypothetical protein